MVSYLVNVTNSKGEAVEYDFDAKKKDLRAMVDKYTMSFPVFREVNTGKTDTSVLLTGASGSFGSNILAALLSNHAISRVHVLSRPTTEGSIQDKLVASFRREGLDGELLLSSKLQCHEGDPSSAGFGLPAENYASIQGSVTHIIHNGAQASILCVDCELTDCLGYTGWRVDFNLSLPSFRSNVASVRNLVDFALGGSGPAPARILFVSSIGIFQSKLLRLSSLSLKLTR